MHPYMHFAGFLSNGLYLVQNKTLKKKKEKIFCTGCGKEIMSDVKFCNYCGKKNTYREA